MTSNSKNNHTTNYTIPALFQRPKWPFSCVVANGLIRVIRLSKRFVRCLPGKIFLLIEMKFSLFYFFHMQVSSFGDAFFVLILHKKHCFVGTETKLLPTELIFFNSLLLYRKLFIHCLLLSKQFFNICCFVNPEHPR